MVVTWGPTDSHDMCTETGRINEMRVILKYTSAPYNLRYGYGTLVDCIESNRAVPYRFTRDGIDSSLPVVMDSLCIEGDALMFSTRPVGFIPDGTRNMSIGLDNPSYNKKLSCQYVRKGEMSVLFEMIHERKMSESGSHQYLGAWD